MREKTEKSKRQRNKNNEMKEGTKKMEKSCNVIKKN